MKNDCIEEFTMGDRTLRIFQDTDPMNPREDWDNPDTMVCIHGRYNLGDHKTTADEQAIIREAGSWEKAQKRLLAYYRAKRNPIVKILPLFLYDHGGITMSTGSFSDRWDSGQVGFIFATRSQVKECFMLGDDAFSAETLERVENNLKSGVAVYDQYLRGDVYGYQVSVTKHCDSCGHDEEDVIDSCWGFFGHNWEENGIFDSAGWESKQLVTEK